MEWSVLATRPLCLAILLAGSDASARETEVRVFDKGPLMDHSFALLVPGHRPMPSSPDDSGAGLSEPSGASWRKSCASIPVEAHMRLSRFAQVRRTALLPLVRLVACAEGVPAGLLDALVIHESRYDAAAVSRKGAIGLTQLMPGTSRALGIGNPWSAAQNLAGGARYLRQQLATFGRYDLALAAYNAGPAQVLRHAGVPPFAETRAYVGGVLRLLLSREESPKGPAIRASSSYAEAARSRRVKLDQFIASAVSR